VRGHAYLKPCIVHPTGRAVAALANVVVGSDDTRRKITESCNWGGFGRRARSTKCAKAPSSERRFPATQLLEPDDSCWIVTSTTVSDARERGVAGRWARWFPWSRMRHGSDFTFPWYHGSGDFTPSSRPCLPCWCYPMRQTAGFHHRGATKQTVSHTTGFAGTASTV
jgi:hypothetical protein